MLTRTSNTRRSTTIRRAAKADTMTPNDPERKQRIRGSGGDETSTPDQRANPADHSRTNLPIRRVAIRAATAAPRMGSALIPIRCSVPRPIPSSAARDSRSPSMRVPRLKGPKAAGHAYLPPKVRTPLNASQHPDEPIARASVPEDDRAAIKKVFER